MPLSLLLKTQDTMRVLYDDSVYLILAVAQSWFQLPARAYSGGAVPIYSSN